MKDEELRKHFSDIKETLSRLEKNGNKKLKESERPYKPRLSLNRFVYIVTIVLIVAFSLFVGYKTYTNSTAERNIDTTTLHATSESKILDPKREKTTGDRIVTIERETDLSITAPDTTSKIAYRILVVSYFIVMALVLFILVYLMKNDDGGIRFDKLNELHSLRNSFFASNDLHNFPNEKSEEVDIIDFSDLMPNEIKMDTKLENPSNVNVNFIVPCKKTIKNKSVMLDLMKSYMNAITEV